MNSSTINIIPSHLINKTKWDSCIDACGYGLIYAKSFYLDRMADNWDGIIVDDYDCVMPVPWRKKYRIRYCYDVPFVQQLGYYSQMKIEPYDLVETLVGYVKYGYYNFNYKNDIGKGRARTCVNLILALNTYPETVKFYSHSFRQSLKHAVQQDLHYSETSPEEAMDLYLRLYRDDLKNINPSNFKNFLQLASSHGIARKVTHKSETLSVVLLLKDVRRLYNIINATTDTGRKKESNYFLYDRVFNEFTNMGLTFDFEGSEIPGVKSFYKKTGAVIQPYSRMHINQLPVPSKLISFLKK